jgi:hypothetical protein
MVLSTGHAGIDSQRWPGGRWHGGARGSAPARGTTPREGGYGPPHTVAAGVSEHLGLK